MTRLALLVADAVADDHAVSATLGRFGYARIMRPVTIEAALEVVAQEHVDLLALPIERADDIALASVERAVRRERHMGVLATAPTHDPALMLRAMRAGIQEFLVRPSTSNDFVAALERLHRRAESVAVNGQVFAIFSAKGGVGTSTVAVNLASALAANHPQGKVAVADLALPGGDVAVLLNAHPAYDMGALTSRIEQLDVELLNSVMSPAADGVWILSAPERAEAADAIDAGAVTTIVGQLRGGFAFTVIDCEHQLNDRTLAALDTADRIVLLTELKVPSLRAAQRTLAIFRRLGYPNEKLCVVVNRLQSGDVVSASEAAQVLKSDIFFKLPNEYRTVSEAATAGRPVVSSHADSPLSHAFLQLAQKLGGGTIAGQEPAASSDRSMLRQIFSRKRN